MKRLLFIPLDWQLPVKPHQAYYTSLASHFNVLYYLDQPSSINFSPDIIFVHSGALVPELLTELKDMTGATVIQWTGDCRSELLQPVMSYKGICDITALACGIGQKDMYEDAMGHKVYYLQHAVEPYQFLSVRENLTKPEKVVFIGNNYDQFPGAVERTQLCKALSIVFSANFEVIGNGFASHEFKNSRAIKYDQTPEIYSNSYIGISANIYNDIEGYWSNRPLDIMAAGSCCLMRYTPRMEKWFTDMQDCVFFSSNTEAISKIQMLLDNPELRNKIALTGQKKVKMFHSYDSRVLELMEIIEKHEQS